MRSTFVGDTIWAIRLNQLAFFFRPASKRNRFLFRDPTLIIATSNTSLSAFERFLFYKSRMRGNAKQRVILRGSPRNGNMCKNGTDERLLFFLMKALRTVDSPFTAELQTHCGERLLIVCLLYTSDAADE